MTTQSLSQFAHEVGRSRDTVSRAIASLALEVPKPAPGKPTELSPTVQEALRVHFGAYPPVGHIREAAPPPVAEIDPKLIQALQFIHKANMEGHKETLRQLALLTEALNEVSARVTDIQQSEVEVNLNRWEPDVLAEPPAPKRPSLAPVAIAAAVLAGLVGWGWLSWQSPAAPNGQGIRESAQSELYQ